MSNALAVQPSAPQYRLTRRGRVVVFALALLAVLMVAFLVSGGSVASEEAGTPPATRVVMVDAGDTLWDLAAAITPRGGDVRDAMARIESMNALPSAGLQIGQRIRVPVE